MSNPTPMDDFDIAKMITEKLKDLEKDRQERILRWVGESIGLAMPRLAERAAAVQVSPQMLQVPLSPTGPTDIKSFMAAKAPKSDTQFAAAVAYYYRFVAPPEQRRERINGDTLQEATRLAGRLRLDNPGKTLNNAKSAGYVDGVSPGEFAINSVGENLVAMALPGGSEGPTVRTHKKRKKK